MTTTNHGVTKEKQFDIADLPVNDLLLCIAVMAVIAAVTGYVGFVACWDAVGFWFMLDRMFCAGALCMLLVFTGTAIYKTCGARNSS
ncbi:MAG: hypothetical protein WCT45_01595 [Candidatus Paceibacterota bacterium]|jgi:hypothetical protein